MIEVIIVMAIIGILAAIAYGSYGSSVQKSRRTDGKDALLSLATKQEQWYLQNSAYTNDVTDIGDANSIEGYYGLAAAHSLGGVACAGTCFTLTASAQGAQLNDTECASLTVDNLGRTASTDSDGNDSTDICW